jgi:Phasin protein
MLNLPKELKMTQKLDNVENLDGAPFNGFTMSDSAVTTKMLAIVAEATDYTKRSLDGRLAFIEKLVGAKSFDSASRIQSEYAKTSFEGFAAQATKMGELYSNLAKVTFKPFPNGQGDFQAVWSGDRSKLIPSL